MELEQLKQELATTEKEAVSYQQRVNGRITELQTELERTKEQGLMQIGAFQGAIQLLQKLISDQEANGQRQAEEGAIQSPISIAQ